MDEKEISEFSWSGLFFVTAICSFLFTGIIRFLDGDTPPLFIFLGCTALFLWVVNGFGRAIIKSSVAESNKRKKSKRPLAS